MGGRNGGIPTVMNGEGETGTVSGKLSFSRSEKRKGNRGKKSQNRN